MLVIASLPALLFPCSACKFCPSSHYHLYRCCYWCCYQHSTSFSFVSTFSVKRLRSSCCRYCSSQFWDPPNLGFRAAAFYERLPTLKDFFSSLSSVPLSLLFTRLFFFLLYVSCFVCMPFQNISLSWINVLLLQNIVNINIVDIYHFLQLCVNLTNATTIRDKRVLPRLSFLLVCLTAFCCIRQSSVGPTVFCCVIAWSPSCRPVFVMTSLSQIRNFCLVRLIRTNEVLSRVPYGRKHPKLFCCVLVSFHSSLLRVYETHTFCSVSM